jgi:hypothetical protein
MGKRDGEKEARGTLREEVSERAVGGAGRARALWKVQGRERECTGVQGGAVSVAKRIVINTSHPYAPVVRDTDTRRRDTAFFRYIEVVPRVKLDPVRCSEGCSEGCNHQCTDEGGHVRHGALHTFLEAGIGRLLEMHEKSDLHAPPNNTRPS